MRREFCNYQSLCETQVFEKASLQMICLHSECVNDNTVFFLQNADRLIIYIHFGKFRTYRLHIHIACLQMRLYCHNFSQ